MIGENGYLIPERLKRDYARNTGYLMVVSLLEQAEVINQDEMIQRMDKIKRQIEK